MENFEDTFHTENALSVNKEIETYLRETSKWAKFLAIFGFIMMGILILAGFGMALAMPALSQAGGPQYPLVMGIVYLAIAVLYFFPLMYLYRFASRIKEAIMVQSENALTSGFENLKSVFKFMGIFTIIMLSLYVIIILFAIVVGTSMTQWF